MKKKKEFQKGRPREKEFQGCSSGKFGRSTRPEITFWCRTLGEVGKKGLIKLFLSKYQIYPDFKSTRYKFKSTKEELYDSNNILNYIKTYRRYNKQGTGQWGSVITLVHESTLIRPFPLTLYACWILRLTTTCRTYVSSTLTTHLK